MTRSLLLLFFRKELRDLRSNRRIWPGYMILPFIGILLPLFLILLLPALVDPAVPISDPGLRLIVEMVRADPTIGGVTFAERLTRLIVRETGLWYLLMPVVLAAGPGALAIVREKEQRTLEPILATPLSDGALVLSKLVGAAGPALLWTAVSAVAGYVVVGLVTWLRLGTPVGPTLGSLVALVFLGPALTAAAALGAIAASARFTDSQSANLFAGLVIVPLTLMMLAVLGRPALIFPWVGVAGSVLVWLACLGLFRRARRRLQREELLTRWR